ncbi:hypothetical protein [Bradyrhizobium genosp. P]|uniref:hypothetical protein n=1 Tax=Bradyrhizobium genosp. P TaxID=83641 RepID=UPI003CE9ADCB
MAVLYLRTPVTFVTPQMWAEDVDFFRLAHEYGWFALSIPMGYLVVTQFFAAIMASYLDPAFAAGIYCYAAIALTLVVVWIVTSPRLDMPSKPLLAVAIVVVPMAYEEVGTLANIQWILPIGIFAMLFMRAPTSCYVLAAEVLLAAFMAVSGPFSIFLTPLFTWRLWTVHVPHDRRRLLLLCATVGAGALLQFLAVARSPFSGGIEPSPHSWTLWFNLPASRIMTTFGGLSPKLSNMFAGISGVLLTVALLTLAMFLAWQRPYRTQKLFMIAFSLCIMIGGMYKFRVALDTQVSANRYFYVASVFSLWFICCLTDKRWLHAALAAFVAVTELTLLPAVAHTPRNPADLEWPSWTRYIDSGLSVTIPTSPGGFYLSLPGSEEGRFARYSSWVGREIGRLAGEAPPSTCPGAIGPIEVLPLISGRIPGVLPQGSDRIWGANGWAWDTARQKSPDLVALVDEGNRVIALAITGFKAPSVVADLPAGTGWRAIFGSTSAGVVGAYAILDEGKHVCRLSGRRSLSTLTESLVSGPPANVAAIAPGTEVSQRFTPKGALLGINVTFVTWGRTPSRYRVNWRVVAYKGGESHEIGAGKIEAVAVADWQAVDLPLATRDELEDQIEVIFTADEPASALIGIPLYRPDDERGGGSSAKINGLAIANGTQLGLTLAYEAH